MPESLPAREVIAQALANAQPVNVTAVEREAADRILMALRFEGYVIVRDAAHDN